MPPDSGSRFGAARVGIVVVAACLAVLALAQPARAQDPEAEPAPPPDTSGEPGQDGAGAQPPETTTIGDGEIVFVPPVGEEVPIGDGGATVAEEVLDLGSLLPDPTPGLVAALRRVDVAERARLAGEIAVAIEVRQDAAASMATVARRRVALEARRDLAVAELARAEARLRSFIVASYVHHGQSAGEVAIQHGEHLDGLATEAMAEAVAETVDREVRTGRIRVLWSEIFLRLAVAELDVAADTVHGTTEALEAKLAEVALLPDPPVAVGPVILGPSFLTVDDLEAWYRSWYGRDPSVAPIRDIAQLYLDVGAAEGVAGDVAFAQAILETGGFQSGLAGRFNFAGIGAYDACSPGCGFGFASLERGVVAHIQLLRAYADPSLTSAMLATTPDRRVAPEEVGVRGCCPYWVGLTGVWATDPYYDRKVLGLYRGMVEQGLGRIRASETNAAPALTG